MKILCKIKRVGGSHVEMPGPIPRTVYHFAPNEHGDHVAEVTDKAHLKILLSIDAYEPYDGPAPTEEPEAPDPAGGNASAGDETPTASLDEVGHRAQLANLTLEELKAEYHHIYGKAAHPQSKHGTLLEKVLAGKLAIASKG